MLARSLPDSAIAQFLAVTASVARIETVMAVPMDMAMTESMPPSHRLFRNAKVSTMSAPEQGRMPTAAMAVLAVFQSNRSPESRAGSGACEWPQEGQTSPGP